MTKRDMSRVMLSVQRALLGVDINALRAVGVRSGGNGWVIVMVVSDELPVSDRDSLTTAITEVMADFDADEISDEIVLADGGQLPAVDAWIYMLD